MNRIFLLVPLLLLTGCGGANWGWYIIDPTTTTGGTTSNSWLLARIGPSPFR